jgi:hypothetical protein
VLLLLKRLPLRPLPHPKTPWLPPALTHGKRARKSAFSKAWPGQLTHKEAARLEKGETRIDKAEVKAKADGKVTPKERAHLEKMQDRQSKVIYGQKHDGQRDMNHDGQRDRHQGGVKK